MLAIQHFTTDIYVKSISAYQIRNSDQEYHCTIQFHDVKEYEEITINRLLQ